MPSSRELGGAALWAVAGLLMALGVLGMASIGLFVLPFGIGAVLLLTARDTPGVWGAAIGAGLFLAALGVVDLVQATPECSSLGVSDPPSPGRPSECEEGGIPNAAFLLLGAGGVLGGVVGAFARPQSFKT